MLPCPPGQLGRLGCIPLGFPRFVPETQTRLGFSHLLVEKGRPFAWTQTGVLMCFCGPPAAFR